MASVTDRLVPCPEPSVLVRLFETQVPLMPGAVTIERYTTARGVVFERHIDPSGFTHWFRVVKNAE